jgi:signal peptidase I
VRLVTIANVNGFTRALLWITVILGAIGLLLYLLVVDVWVVGPGDDRVFAASIFPTLMPEDKVLVHRGHVPKTGELARCASPLAPGSYVVGRVFGVPGDRVEVGGSVVRTNGTTYGTRHLCEAKVMAHPITENLVTLECNVGEGTGAAYEFLSQSGSLSAPNSAIVEAGKLYLVSDNRVMHQDSRDFGQIEASTCEHILFRLWGEHYSDASRRFNVLW